MYECPSGSVERIQPTTIHYNNCHEPYPQVTPLGEVMNNALNDLKILLAETMRKISKVGITLDTTNPGRWAPQTALSE